MLAVKDILEKASTLTEEEVLSSIKPILEFVNNADSPPEQIASLFEAFGSVSLTSVGTLLAGLDSTSANISLLTDSKVRTAIQPLLNLRRNDEAEAKALEAKCDDIIKAALA